MEQGNRSLRWSFVAVEFAARVALPVQLIAREMETDWLHLRPLAEPIEVG
jgi:hypothetical protein